MDFTPNALRVLEARYLRRDATGRVVEKPAELIQRVARAVAQAELLLGTAAAADRWQETFESLLGSLDFLPNSPTLMNAGTPLGQLAACFVLPVEDSMDGIFGALHAMAILQRGGGGSGFSFSRLRPTGDIVASTGGEASGPVSFMRVFDCATENIKLGGRRRGANMGALRVDHPDIVEFAGAKRTPGAFTNFNLSVAVTDRFMEAVASGEHYDLIHPRHGRATGRLSARAVFDAIVQAAWETGDPGLLYLDAIARANPTPALGGIEATNPCGEVPLLAWESCVLGSVNLAHMVRVEDGDPAIDWARLRHAVRTGVRFLDDVIEINRDPLPAIAVATRATRKIGLGVMGFAECLIRLGVGYGTGDAVVWADRLIGFIADEARGVSRELAEERGTFPAWRHSIHGVRHDRRRHATLLSIAPTGTLGILAGTSAGIEPLYALAYRRAHTLGGEPLPELNPVFQRWAEQQRVDAAALVREVAAAGTLAAVASVPPAVRRLFVTATELDVDRHLAVQHAFQRHVDNAVSKTINLPESASAEAVAGAYLHAWRLGLKGVTVYRSGSRDAQVLTLGLGEEPAAREHFARCDVAACRL
ncbi:MAG: adenosylcobalamin-dependent ribonucleoside-diphosphate reductase [Candidatus Rokuibacteriota bacterium]